MRAVPARSANHSAAERESLRQVWEACGLAAARPLLWICATLGAVGIASLVALPTRWAWLPLSFVVVGSFGIRGLATQSMLATSTTRATLALTAVRAIADFVASVAAVVAIVIALAFVFGGSVGVMRG